MAEHALRLAAAQHVGVVDRVAADERRADERQQLAPGPGSARPLAEVERLVDHLLDPEPTRERARQDKTCVGHRTLVVEGEREPVYTSPARSHHGTFPVVTIWMTSWAQDSRLRTQPVLPAQEVIFGCASDDARPIERWIGRAAERSIGPRATASSPRVRLARRSR